MKKFIVGTVFFMSGVVWAALAPPSNVTATAQSSTSVQISWTGPSSSGFSYRVQRSSSSTFSTGTVTIADGLTSATTSFTATGLKASTTYYFRVRAKYATGNSAYVNAPAVTTPAASTVASLTMTIPAARPAVVTVGQVFTVTCNATPPSGQTIDRVLFYYYRDGAGVPLCVPNYPTTGPVDCAVTGTGPNYTISNALISALPAQSGNDVIQCTAKTNLNQSINLPTETQVNVQGAAVTVPSAPSGMNGSATSSSQVNLTWNDNSNNETGFTLDRATDVGFTANLNSVSVASGSTSYAVTGLSASTTYYFRVKAVNSAGSSAYATSGSITTQAAAVTLPSAPSGMNGSAASSSQVNLTWNDNSNNETGFTLDRATDVGFTANLVSASVAAGSTSYNVTGLAASTGYYFRVKATNTAGSSAYATSGVITTQSASAGVNMPTYNWFEGNKLSVLINARVQSSPAQITLYWSAISGRSASSISIYRKSKGATSWGSAVASPATTATQWADTAVSVGTEYEYKVQMATNAGTAYGFISSGIAVDLPAYRGKMVLLVDSTIESAISTQLATLKKDLNSDGWIVIQKSVSQASSPSTVKNLIKTEYNLDPTNVKAVYILGHLAVPYSGKINPDGHGDHLGAWPSDGYYGDMDGNWTDSSLNWTGASNSFYNNVPGDGKFDHNDFPSTMELQVGRVDLNRMDAFSAAAYQNPPSYPLDDPGLYNNYLDKAHNFKTKAFSPQKRGIIYDNFTGYQISTSGWRNLSTLVGTSNMVRKSNVSGDPDITSTSYAQAIGGQSYLWTYACGGGGFTGAPGLSNISTWDMYTLNAGGVFTMSYGSYFGDWNNNNNFLRAHIAGGQGLTSVYAGSPNWQFHHMGMGETIGYGTQVSMSNILNNLYLPLTGYASSTVQMALMGDPSLRLTMVAPPTNVAIVSGSTFGFTWTHSADSASAGFLGYNVYEIQSGTIRKVNSSIITGTSYTSPDTYSTGKTYVVRAVKLETSETGTYNNLSIGGLVSN